MGRKSRLLEASIIVLAIAVRVAAVLVLRSHEVARSTYEHGEIAANLLAGRGFSMTVPGGRRPDLAAGAGLSDPGGGGLRDRGRRHAAGLAAPGAGTIRPGRTPRLGRHAAGRRGRPGRRHGWPGGRTDRRPSTRRSSMPRRTCRSPALGADPARLDAGLGLSARERPGRLERRRDHRGLPRPPGADRPDPLAGDDRDRLGRSGRAERGEPGRLRQSLRA